MKKLQKVTLEDIAAETGFSVSTVSRAISNSGKISSETIKIVYESAQRLNYPLKNLNTPIELRKNIFIVLLTRFHVGEFYSSFYHGFDMATKGTNTNIALLSISNTGVDEVDMINELYKSSFDAAILFLPDLDQDDYRKIIDGTDPEFPVISVASIANPVMETITFDTYRGGYMVAQHFLEMGYKKMGIVLGPQDKSDAMLRKNGFIDFISRKEDLDLVWHYEGDYENHSGTEAYNSYKMMKDKPDAIFCSNDSMAVGFIQSAISDGVKIPGDLAVAGYDDLPICSYHSPSITSVHTSFEMLGKKAVDYLTDSLNSRTKVEHNGHVSMLPVSLNVRESSLKDDKHPEPLPVN
ncbi:MAG TPA: LacI family DNA-binding transcriptional regulator [Balneolaceae bacterium]|nr:LacI family DNA-binding transcriptional regulator [Balneolaceae bacterium]